MIVTDLLRLETALRYSPHYIYKSDALMRGSSQLCFKLCGIMPILQVGQVYEGQKRWLITALQSNTVSGALRVCGYCARFCCARSARRWA